MNAPSRKPALESQPQADRCHSRINSLRYQSRRVGTLPPLAVLLLFLFPAAVFPRTIRVMTYNIHVGVGMDKKLDLQRIADVIKREHVDLVGLQEVDRGVERTQR